MFVGKKVLLRAVREEDFSTFHEWWSDPEVLTHQSSGPLILRSKSANEEMFRSWVKESSTGVSVSIERKEDGVLIGQCSLWGLSPSGHYATLGIVFGRAFWNQGYGSEALKLILNYAFNELNLNRVQLTVNANNPRAVRTYQKAGFQEEGRAREAFFGTEFGRTCSIWRCCVKIFRQGGRPSSCETYVLQRGLDAFSQAQAPCLFPEGRPYSSPMNETATDLMSIE